MVTGLLYGFGIINEIFEIGIIHSFGNNNIKCRMYAVMEYYNRNNYISLAALLLLGFIMAMLYDFV